VIKIKIKEKKLPINCPFFMVAEINIPVLRFLTRENLTLAIIKTKKLKNWTINWELLPLA
jgi:hypothetical protein